MSIIVSIAASVLGGLLIALIIGAAGLLFSRGPMKISNRLLREQVADYERTVALGEKENAELLVTLKDVKDNLDKANREIDKLSRALAQITLDKLDLEDRVAQLEQDQLHKITPARARARRAAAAATNRIP